MRLRLLKIFLEERAEQTAKMQSIRRHAVFLQVQYSFVTLVC